MKRAADPMRYWGLTAAFFALVTVLYQWPAVLPWAITSQLQARDSVLSTAIFGHIHEAMAGRASYWQIPMFHPLPDTQCLSEPMITPALVTWPFAHVFGLTAAGNLWIYFCSFTGAMATWAYLRYRGLKQVPAVWGAFAATFTTSLIWHAIGQYQLLFQAGFPLALLAAERMARSRSRWWGVLFVLAIAATVFTGFYIALLLAVWCAFLVPTAVWASAGGRKDRTMLAIRRHGPVVAAGLALILVGMVPLAARYRAYGKQFPQNPHEILQFTSATWKGYLIPSTNPEHGMTFPGMVISQLVGTTNRFEDTEHVGMIALALIIAAPFLFRRPWVRDRRSRAETGFWYSMIALALFAFVMSLGVYSPVFRAVYSWLEAFRFFRVPARFAFLVQWCFALGGAHVLNALADRWQTRGSVHFRAVPALALALTMVEFFPLNSITHIPAGKSLAADYLRNHYPHTPMFEVTQDTNRLLVRFMHSQTPIANGYSGYLPLQREQELTYLDRHLNSPGALALLNDWGIKLLFLDRESTSTDALHMLAAGTARPIWSSAEGTLCELTTSATTIRDYAASLRNHTPRRDIELVSKSLLTSQCTLRTYGRVGWSQYRGDFRDITVGWNSGIGFVPISPIKPGDYHHLRLRIRSSNWYCLNDRAMVTWMTAGSQDFEYMQRFEFCLPSDNKWHDVDLDLGSFVPWLAGDPVTMMVLQPGMRSGNEVSIESAQLVSGE